MFSGGLWRKFPTPPCSAATPWTRLWESGSSTCPGKSFNWLQVLCGPRGPPVNHAYLPVRGRVHFTHSAALMAWTLLRPCLVWLRQHVASSRLLQSVSGTPNMESRNLQSVQRRRQVSALGWTSGPVLWVCCALTCSMCCTSSFTVLLLCDFIVLSVGFPVCSTGNGDWSQGINIKQLVSWPQWNYVSRKKPKCFNRVTITSAANYDALLV